MLIKRNIVGLRMVKFTVLDIDKVDAIATSNLDFNLKVVQSVSSGFF